MILLRIISLVILIVPQVFGQSDEGLVNLNGTKLYLKSEGQGEPILVVHGGPGMNHQYFLPHLNGLSEDFKIIYYDQRASGKSAIPWIDSITMDFFADDIEAIRQHLRVDKINILAHSWGALPATLYGIKYPDKVGKMILCNSVPLSKAFEDDIRRIAHQRTSGLDSTDRSIIKGSPNYRAGKSSAYRKLLLLSFRNSFHKKSNLKHLNIEVPENYVSASSALFGGLSGDLSAYDYYDQVAKFNFPVLLLHGKHDAMPIAADELAKEKIPNATLEVFKKSGHFIFVEENKKFTSAIQKFMGR